MYNLIHHHSTQDRSLDITDQVSTQTCLREIFVLHKCWWPLVTTTGGDIQNIQTLHHGELRQWIPAICFTGSQASGYLASVEPGGSPRSPPNTCQIIEISFV